MADRVAAFDCGTNTIKLLVLEDGERVFRESRIVRLGQGVDATGRLADEALERAFAAIDDFASVVRDHEVGPDRIRFCATSATRDAANAEVFVAGVRERLGVEVEVLSGSEEAALSYDGAVRGLGSEPDLPVMVLDIGGGSTELILGEGEPVAAHSMDIGSVRLHERHLRDDPPTPAQVRACIDQIDAHLDDSPVDPARAATLVGVAGTTLSVVAGVLDLPTYDPERIDQSVVSADDVHAFVERLVAMRLEERLALPWMHPQRADVLDAGALILSRVLHRCTVDSLVASEADIVEGIAWSISTR